MNNITLKSQVGKQFGSERDFKAWCDFFNMSSATKSLVVRQAFFIHVGGHYYGQIFLTTTNTKFLTQFS